MKVSEKVNEIKKDRTGENEWTKTHGEMNKGREKGKKRIYEDLEELHKDGARQNKTDKKRKKESPKYKNQRKGE
jgi:hypothetical protein